jgi:hypothetical protein
VSAAAAPRPIALRRSASFGARPGSGAGSFKRTSSFVGRHGSSFQDLSNRGSAHGDSSNHSSAREPLLPPEE